MSCFDSKIKAKRSKVTDSSSTDPEALQTNCFSNQLEALALFLAKTWKDEHSHLQLDSTALDECILAVTRELAIAATAVGGPIGLEILTGGGSAAACVSCRQVLQEAVLQETADRD